MAKTRSRLARISSCTSRGIRSQTSSAPCGLFSSTVAPGRATESTSIRSSSENWWQATKSACSMRYDERIGRSARRRWETVTAPDFLES